MKFLFLILVQCVIFEIIVVLEIDQDTSPAELPIVGDPDSQIQLDAVFPQNRQLFRLDGKRLRLLQPIDRDSGNVSHVVFQVHIIKYSIGAMRC